LVWGIPLLEVAISIAVLFERTRLAGFYAAFILMCLFSIYTGIVLMHFFSYIPCSCGGVIRKLTWPQHLALNLFYVALSVVGIILQHHKSLKTSIKTNKHSLV
jgi:hypothetical protein